MQESHEFTEAFLKKIALTKTNIEFLETLESKPRPSTAAPAAKKVVKNSAS
jgi:transcription termination factor Rho